MKIRIGIFFGGQSRELEMSFAGGRTVYDNLDKSLFEAIPFFIDSFGNFILLDWQYVYKGSIRDFYPPVSSLKETQNDYQIYAESLGNLNRKEQKKLSKSLGKIVSPEDLSGLIDFAFLCLHGPYGEDGRIQGLFEYLSIPYSGSGILSSAIGINKSVQKKLMKAFGFAGPPFITVQRSNWTAEKEKEHIDLIVSEIGFPCVIKPAHQGSSIGVSIVSDNNREEIKKAMNRAFFMRDLRADEWIVNDASSTKNIIRLLSDIRDGIGLPLMLSANGQTEKIHHPDVLETRIQKLFSKGLPVLHLEGCDREDEVVVERFIEGKEFSCIVIQNEDGNPVALPPTEIRKGKNIYDYRSKYLPGLSRKITPVELPYEQIQNIRQECEKLFLALHFNVYARIDGFITSAGKVFLNDPNTTSGMMPSSFFFHQAAEIGLNPSQFLTYIIRTSLRERLYDMNKPEIQDLLESTDASIDLLRQNKSRKINVAVIMGGYSSERHISVESGRNVYEKLSSSDKYNPIPVFLTGSENNHILYQLPVNLLLKDNADDIREKVSQYSLHEVVKEIMMLCEHITSKYSAAKNVLSPVQLTYSELAEIADVAFIALHGRPGEDGAVQKELEKVNIPYNGSGVLSSGITINKFGTNEILKQHGFSVASHMLVQGDEWKKDKSGTIQKIQKDFAFPFIVKPVDDGCSSAVKIVRNETELIAFGDMIFRETPELNVTEAAILQLKNNEEFPLKNQFLIESLITSKGAERFLEVTGGLLTRISDKGECVYEIFESSEALSGGDVLSLEEKFLAGEGQNITPARFSVDLEERQRISDIIKNDFMHAAKLLGVEGYARIDAFVRIFSDGRVETIFIEVNSLPGMTPATCIFHQAALAGYKPYDFIDRILEYGMKKKKLTVNAH